MPQGIDFSGAVNNFLNTYMSVSQFKQNQKYEKFKPMLALADSMLNDPNMSYKQKSKMIDAIPSMMGIKMDAPLSVQFGLDKFMDEQVETGKTSKVSGQAGTSGPVKATDNFTADEGDDAGRANQLKNIVNQAVQRQYNTSAQQALPETLSTESQVSGTVGQDSTQATNDIPSVSLYQKKGDLTPSDIQFASKRKIDRQAFSDEMEKMEYAAQLKMRYAGISHIERTYKDGNLVLQGVKDNGELVQIPVGAGLTSEAVEVAKVRNLGNNGLTGAARNFQRAYEMLNDPESSAAEKATAQKIIQDSSLSQEQKVATIKSLGQKNTGTTPPTPEQTTDNARQDEILQLGREEKHSALVSKAEETSKAVTAKATEIKDFEGQLANLESDLQKLKDDGAEESDPNRIQVQRQISTLKGTIRNRRTEYDELNAKDKALKGQVTESENRLNKKALSSPQGATKLSSNQKSIVDKARKIYSAEFGKFSDEQVWNYLHNLATNGGQ